MIDEYTQLKRRRLEMGLTQHQLSALSGISRSAIEAYEKKKCIPSLWAAVQLSKSMNRSLEELFREHL